MCRKVQQAFRRRSLARAVMFQRLVMMTATAKLMARFIARQTESGIYSEVPTILMPLPS
jgi:hypothetical protein